MAGSEYTTGWFENSVHELLAGVSDLPSGMAYALITCLDSSTDVGALLRTSPALSVFAKKATIVGSGILVPSRLLTGAEAPRIFFGFDEVWFFARRDVLPKPPGLTLVGPKKMTHAELKPHLKWLVKNDCSLGLGDGAGLNFCARVRGVARLLLEAFEEPAAA